MQIGLPRNYSRRLFSAFTVPSRRQRRFWDRTNIVTLFRLILILLCLFFASKTYGQGYNLTDTLSTKERETLSTAIRHNGFGYWQLADSCSRKSDSIDAGRYLLKVDPYIFLFEEIAPDTIDSYLQHVFMLTVADRKKYTTAYQKAYAAPRCS